MKSQTFFNRWDNHHAFADGWTMERTRLDELHASESSRRTMPISKPARLNSMRVVL